MWSVSALLGRRRRPAAGRRPATLLCLAAALILASLWVAADGQGRLRTPVPTSPANGAVTEAVPAFAWTGITGAASYEFQIAADAGMNSPVLGRGKDQFITKNLRATLLEAMPNGTYYWRVRAITESGDTSPWSRPRSFNKRWSASATLQTPTSAESVAYPLQPLKLSWTAVPGASSYRVSIATDPTLGTLFGGKSVDTSATSFTRAGVLASGTYYWAITPLDARGNPGISSSVSSFTWVWPSGTTPRVTDLAAEPEIFDPQFSWDRVPGAARYEVEVNPSHDWATGSRVCCTASTIATALSPTRLLKDNVYYWRVRAIDADGNAGSWVEGPVFEKRFDKVPPVAGPSIKNLHMRDNLTDPGVDASGALGYQTQVPIAVWDPVPGASSYLVEVAKFDSGDCQWATSPWTVPTAVPAWTPLGNNLGVSPYPDPTPIAHENPKLEAGKSYCVRVRARSDRDAGNDDVYGDFAYLDDGSGAGFAFTWVGPPTGAACSPSCASGYLGRDDYGLPGKYGVAGPATVTRTPLFTWKPLAGKQSYFIIVSKDSSFSNIVDYAFTEFPAYAPRRPLSHATTYPDELTAYYWVVLPASAASGSDAVGNPLLGAAASFHKQSVPPTRLGPSDNADILDQPTFRWTATEGARRYRLQVAQDPTFANPIDDVATNATAFTSDTTYPADTKLYWRVRADDENLIGLTWSTSGTFQKRLAKPNLSPVNPTAGDYIPTWLWDPTPGAVSYDVAADLPDGTHRDLKGLSTAALTPTLMYGTGKFSWKVRANFPTTTPQVVPGPYSPISTFTRTIGEPGGAHADVSKKHILLSWEPKAGVKGYLVQISERGDFARLVEQVKTDNTSYAPRLTRRAYQDAPVLYWRVAAFDEGNNVGDFTQAQAIARAKRLALSATGRAARGRAVVVTITVVDKAKRPLRLVRVRVTGAGVPAVTRRTDGRGKAKFKVRATRAGSVTYRATKTGYEPGVLTQRVR